MDIKEPEVLVHYDFATGPSHGLVELEVCGGRSWETLCTRVGRVDHAAVEEQQSTHTWRSLYKFKKARLPWHHEFDFVPMCGN